ncbi:MAG: hypothetical protein BGO69_18225 [Bacteroidetes bacterium 46-16]|nr:MAG: hypothetical protein BGO69_18225 [Bacteroidetes bacterium 46-16]
MGNRHKVFISFHSVDIYYKQQFERLFANVFDVMVSRSVDEGDISDYLPAETVRQKIRDEYLRDSTVTVVLIGKNTWQRKHVDWEIGSSIRDTKFNSRSGLLGVLLPTYPSFPINRYDYNTIPPRLSDNIKCEYADIYAWDENPLVIQDWIHRAFLKRNTLIPDNSYPPFIYNRSGERWT